LGENVSAFKQIPAAYRMTNREVENKPSPFIESTLRPFAQLNANSVFAGLSDSLREKVFRTVLSKALTDLDAILLALLTEERKMHDSL